MQTLVGDMWQELGKADLILVTTNSTLKSNGELVMGAGAAMQAAQRFPELPRVFGRRIRQDFFGQDYGIMCGLCTKTDHTWIGAFQTKRHWRDPASLDLIRYSAERLAAAAGKFSRIALNFPGIGHGQLQVADVLPILEELPENIVIYTTRPIPTETPESKVDC